MSPNSAVLSAERGSVQGGPTPSVIPYIRGIGEQAEEDPGRGLIAIISPVGWVG